MADQERLPVKEVARLARNRRKRERQAFSADMRIMIREAGQRRARQLERERQWARVGNRARAAMATSDSVGGRLVSALEEALAFEGGEETGATFKVFDRRSASTEES